MKKLKISLKNKEITIGSDVLKFSEISKYRNGKIYSLDETELTDFTKSKKIS